MAVIAGELALVTGGARGIGRSIAAMLRGEGVRVALADLDYEAVKATAAELQRLEGAEVRAFPLDVRSREGFAELVGQVEADWGPVGILVNNAGIMTLGAFTDQPPELDDRQIDVNLRGVIAGMRAVIPGMKARKHGHIVNIASTAGKIGIPFAAVYSATKFGVIGLTEAVHIELEGTGVHLSYVMPGPVRTELTAGTGDLRWPKPIFPEDVANAVRTALLTKQVDIFVPAVNRLAVVLPALVPRRVYERVGKFFGIAEIFRTTDPEKRAGYRGRVHAKA